MHRSLDGYAAPEICQGALNTIMNLFPSSHISVLELFKNIDLLDSLGCVDFPSSPVTIIVEIILSGTGLKDTVTGYGPRKFVFESGHFNGIRAKYFV